MVSQQISHYRIIEKLGAGGMGEVFLAHDLTLDRKVAIKILPAKSIENEQAKKRLFREAKAAATLDHPNICTIHEVNEEADSPFIVMQYIDGVTLANKVRNNPLAPAEVVNIGIQAAEALAEAHSRGVVHRDIKPQNMMITARGQLKILDFGLARQILNQPAVDSQAQTETRLTEEGQIVGTVGYMSPEQLRGYEMDARSDVFSLGVTLYECATGSPAFTGNSAIEISSQILHVDPPKPSRVKPGIPPALERVILKAMAKEIEERYQSASIMLEDLYRLRGSISGSSEMLTRPLTLDQRPASVATVVSRAWQRKPIKVAAFLAPVLLVAILLGLRLWHPALHQPSPDAKNWYDQGLVAMQQGTYYQASKRLERSIGLDDGYALSHARLAETYLEINDSERAMQELLRAISLVPNRSSLATADALYLDAVGATIRREFPAAIDAYRKLLNQVSPADKANASVDLGRAYEKDEKLDKAAESYMQAVKLDPNSPAGFLRLAILYSRRQDSQHAEENFKKAENLYQAMSNAEGQVEVLYQRGALLARTGKSPEEARTQLEKVLEILKNADDKVDNKYQLVRTQLQLSLVARDQGNLERAKALAAEAIQLAQNNNLKNLAANGLIDLGLALVSRGNFDEAGRYFKQALDLAERDGARSSKARAILALARVNQQLGNNDEAISGAQEALTFYRDSGYVRETSISLTVLGRAHQDKGEEDVALKIFEQQLQLSRDADDQSGVADSHMNLALLRGLNQGLYPEALSHLDDKYKIDEARGAQGGMGFDQMNRGAFLWQLGRYPEARAALDAAFKIANRPEGNYKTVLAWVHLTNAQMALSERRYDDAKKASQLALDTSASQFPDVTLHAKYCMGRAQAFTGAVDAGRKSCEEAVAMAKKGNSPQLISSALLALAEVMLIGHDPKGALENSLEAQKIFAKAGQQDSEWRAQLIAARAQELIGDKSAAQGYAAQADKLCAGLEEKWGKEAYAGYLRRPDIQNYRSQLDQILKLSK
ncbi:MAG: eukaryotic-like serine/threonine-protein kinase [Blastocatellia bacterium]|nr:eukaryotic-like serine/threonine-protein kinase [Blastocatellia bacterium]